MIVPRALTGWRPGARLRGTLAVAGLAAGLALIIALVRIASERAQGSHERAAPYPAVLAQRVDYAPAGAYKQPSDVAFIDGRTFLLDTGNNRIVELDSAGGIKRVLDRSTDGRLALQGAMALTSDGRYLYVANSDASQVIVLEPTGSVVKVVDLSAVVAGEKTPPRPVGLAAGRNGELFVSDVANQRVLSYGADGRVRTFAGNGQRSGGEGGFNAPAGVTVDDAGNLYVVDVLNGRVVELSPDGSFVRQFGSLGDTGGALSRPKDVAVDSRGNVYVADTLLASVQVFSAGGEYLGFIGRQDPADQGSKSLFRAPAGLKVSGNRLYVVDRFAGLFVFDLPR